MLMIILSITPWKKTLIGQMVGVHGNLAMMVIVIHIIECIIIIVHSTSIEWGHSLVTSMR